jgi:polyisoprenoid-binding protein YceI
MPRPHSGLLAALVLAASATPFASAPAALAEAGAGVSHDPAAAPAGDYKLDPRHTSVIARVVHMGFSHFAIRFSAAGGTLNWDPADPTKSKIDVTIDGKSVQSGVPALDRDVVGALFADDPIIHFVSTRIERTGPTTGRITGDLTLHGVTKPVVLDTVFDGTGRALGSQRMGFSAKSAIRQSDFGADKFSQWVSDDMTLEIETEFTK